MVALTLVWYFFIRHVVLEASDIVSSPSFKDAASTVIGYLGMKSIMRWNAPELAMFWGLSLFIFPLFSFFISADQTSTDRERGTLRFVSLRCSRRSIFFGRYLGQMTIQSLMVFSLLVVVILVGVYNKSAPVGHLMETGFIMFLNIMIVMAPFIALMALMSAIFDTAKQSIIVATILCGGLTVLFAWLSYHLPFTSFLMDLIPGIQVWGLVRETGWHTFDYMWVPLIQTGIFLTLGNYVFARRAL